MYDLSEEPMSVRGEWNIATTMFGGQCVMIFGVRQIPMLSVDNLDSHLLVSVIIAT